MTLSERSDNAFGEIVGAHDVSAADCAVMRVHASGQILSVSKTGDVIAGLWQDYNDELLTAYGKAIMAHMPFEARISIAGEQNFWLVLIPDGPECIIVARDTTLPDKMMQALIDSRKLLKELLDQAVDLAFEVDMKQNFKFITPNNALGFDVSRWLGANANTLFWGAGVPPFKNPFMEETKKKYDAVLVNILGTESRYLSFDVTPKSDETGKQIGVRGTVCDVTAHAVKKHETRMINLRLTVQKRITDSLNAAETADALLDGAAQILHEILRANIVHILVNFDDGLTQMAQAGEADTPLNVDAIEQAIALKSDEAILEAVQDNHTHLVINLRQDKHLKGAVVLSRNTDTNPWSKEEKSLLKAVGDVLLTALQKAELVDRLYKLSMQDELTGLLNRRAVKDSIDRCLKHHKRSGSFGTLVFIDLDNFKEVNDTLGHAAGDLALKLVAEHITKAIRPTDYAGRYGGDEFVIWLEGAGIDIARKKINALISAMSSVREKLGNRKLKLSISAGIAVSASGIDSSFERIAERADQALYIVKESGKGAIAVADPLNGEE